MNKHLARLKAAVKAIVSDGCTCAPDFNFRECCEAHDLRYRENPENLSRKDADALFRDCIIQHGHPGLAWIYWGAVRMFGWRAWNRYRSGV